jgi:hypothetical protein
MNSDALGWSVKARFDIRAGASMLALPVTASFDAPALSGLTDRE